MDRGTIDDKPGNPLGGFLTAASRPFRAALTSRRGRWWLLTVVTLAGWLALGLWMLSADDTGGDDALWTMLLICGLVGIGQLLALLPLGTDQPRARTGKKRRQKSGTWLLRWWQVVLLAVTHILVVIVLSYTLVQPVEYDEPQLGTAFLVLFLGTIGWFLVPLILFVAIVVMALVVGLFVAGISRFATARRLPRELALSRARSVSGGIAMIGGGLALASLIVAIPFVSTGHTVASHKGAAVAAAVVLLLQAIGVVPSPHVWWYALIRVGYLAGVAAVLQYATFRWWGTRLWRNASPTELAGHEGVSGSSG